jgi:hypothetical protein
MARLFEELMNPGEAEQLENAVLDAALEWTALVRYDGRQAADEAKRLKATAAVWLACRKLHLAREKAFAKSIGAIWIERGAELCPSCAEAACPLAERFQAMSRKLVELKEDASREPSRFAELERVYREAEELARSLDAVLCAECKKLGPPFPFDIASAGARTAAVKETT